MLACVRSADAADRASIAIVTEISGAAELMQDGTSASLRLLSELKPDARVRVANDAHVVILYLQNGDQFVLSGPGTYSVHDGQPVADKQAAGFKRLGPVTGKDGKAMQVRSANVSQAAIVVRTAGRRPIPLKHPKGPFVLGPTFQFEWETIGREVEYDFLLKDETGNTVFSRILSENRLTLPSNVALDAGAGYRWSVSARGADGTRYLSVYVFRVADPETRSQSENFRPGETATLAERVAYAAWLDGSGLNDEAGRYWEELNQRYGVTNPRN